MAALGGIGQPTTTDGGVRDQEDAKVQLAAQLLDSPSAQRADLPSEVL